MKKTLLTGSPVRDKLAQIIRIVSVPPVMVALLAVLLYTADNGVFRNIGDVLAALICLALLPAAAYPLSLLFPRLKRQGREGQRNLAFITSCVGYAAGFTYALARGSGRLICLTGIYVISVILLALCNKVLHRRASGHGCSVVGPLVIAALCFGFPAFLLCTGLYFAILWASLYLKRHTLPEFLTGSLICLAAIGISAGLCSLAGIL